MGKIFSLIEIPPWLVCTNTNLCVISLVSFSSKLIYVSERQFYIYPLRSIDLVLLQQNLTASCKGTRRDNYSKLSICLVPWDGT